MESQDKNNENNLKLLTQLRALNYNYSTELAQNIIDLIESDTIDINFSDIIRKEQRTILFIASSGGHANIVELLLNKGAEIDKPDIYGNTPLHAAVEAGHINIVKLLLDNGANINKTNNNEYTPLYTAVEIERPDIVDLLLKKGAKIRFESKPNTTPIHHISIYETGDIGVELLNVFIKNGVNINEQDIHGYTPLHIASTNNNYKIAKVLIENSDNLDIKTDNGKTAFDIATEKHRPEIITLLQNAASKEGKSNPVENNLKKETLGNTTQKDNYTYNPLHANTELFINPTPGSLAGNYKNPRPTNTRLPPITHRGGKRRQQKTRRRRNKKSHRKRR